MNYNPMFCTAQKYCTDCPTRSECEIRRKFYLDSFSSLNDLTYEIIIHSPKFKEFSPEFIAECAAFVHQTFEEKRKEELKQHPTYVTY